MHVCNNEKGKGHLFKKTSKEEAYRGDWRDEKAGWRDIIIF